MTSTRRHIRRIFLIAWAALILVVYLQHHHLGDSLRFIVYLLGDVVTQATPSLYLFGVLRSSGLMAIFFVSVLIWGGACIVRADPSFPGALVPGVGLALGLGVTSSAMAALTFARILYPPAVWGIYLLSIGAAVGCLASKRFRPDLSVLTELSTAHKSLLAILSAALWGGTLIPEITHDPLVYHLAYPALYKIHHGFVPMPFSFYASFPQTIEMLYLFGLSIGDEITSKAFQFGMAASLILIFLGAASRWFQEKRIGVWAALAFCSPPMIFFNVWNCMIDIGTTLFAFAALTMIAEATEACRESRTARSRTLFILAGLFCGWAMGTKYTAFPLILLIPLAAWMAGRRMFSHDSRFLRYLIMFGMAAFLTVSPWIIRNVLVHQNPVYPFFGTKWGHPPVGEFHMKKFLEAAVADQTLLAPFHWLRYERTTAIGADIGPAFLFCVGCLLVSFLPRRDRPPDMMVSCCAWLSLFGGLLWAFTGGLPRFVMPYLAPLFFLWSRWAVSDAFIGTGVRAAALLIFSVSYVTAAADLTVLKGRHVLLGKEDKETFLTRPHALYPSPPYAAYQFIHLTSPPDAGVLVLGDARAYYLHRSFLIGTPHDPSPIVVLARQSTTGEDLYRLLAEKNIRDIVLNAAEARRVHSHNFSDWDEQSERVLREFWSAHIKLAFRHVDESEDAALFVYEIVNRSAEPPPIPEAIFSSVPRASRTP